MVLSSSHGGGTLVGIVWYQYYKWWQIMVVFSIYSDSEQLIHGGGAVVAPPLPIHPLPLASPSIHTQDRETHDEQTHTHTHPHTHTSTHKHMKTHTH